MSKNNCEYDRRIAQIMVKAQTAMAKSFKWVNGQRSGRIMLKRRYVKSGKLDSSDSQNAGLQWLEKRR